MNLNDNNYFHNFLIPSRWTNSFWTSFLIDALRSVAPYNSVLVCTHLSTELHAKTVDYIHNELRTAFELTYLLENYATALTGSFGGRSIDLIRSVSVLESPDLYSMAEISSFKFFSCNLHYGPNFTFSVRVDSLWSLDRRSSVWFQVSMSYNQKYSAQQESNFENRLDLRFTTINNRFLSTAHQLLNRKLMLFFAKTRSLKQFVRVRKIKNVIDDREIRSSFFSVVTHDIGSDCVDRTTPWFQSTHCRDESSSLLFLLKTISIHTPLRC